MEGLLFNNPSCNCILVDSSVYITLFDPGVLIYWRVIVSFIRIPGNNLFCKFLEPVSKKNHIRCWQPTNNWSLCCLHQMNRRGSQCTKKQKKFVTGTWKQFWTSLRPFERQHSSVQKALLLEVLSKKCWRLLIQLDAWKCLLNS